MPVLPGTASVLVGVNDTLRGTFDVAAIGTALSTSVGALRAAGVVVLTARLPGPGRMFGPTRRARPALARRIRAVNAVTDTEITAVTGVSELSRGGLASGAYVSST
jgi:hypothetical protein